MAYFTAPQLEILSKSTVRVATLVEFRFDPIMRYSNAYSTIVCGGVEWLGLGHLGDIEGLHESRTGQSLQVKFTLSGTNPEINAMALAIADKTDGKDVTVFLQLFADNWGNVGDPIPIFFGVTDPMTISRSPTEDGDGAVRSVSITAENVFQGRSRAGDGRYSAKWQRARYPGDAFLDYVYQLRDQTYIWP